MTNVEITINTLINEIAIYNKSREVLTPRISYAAATDGLVTLNEF